MHDLIAPGLEEAPGWMTLFGPLRERLGMLLAQPGHEHLPTRTALEVDWLLEVQRLPHESERRLDRQEIEHQPLRTLLAACAAQMYDDTPAAARWAARVIEHFDYPVHLWAQCTLVLARLESGEPAKALGPLLIALRGADCNKQSISSSSVQCAAGCFCKPAVQR
jgi:hypothetical protein